MNLTGYIMHPPTFKIFTAYEDSGAHHAAGKINSLFAAFSPPGRSATVNVAMKFSELEAGRSHATHAAGVADVIIIALSGHADLPKSLLSWIQGWPDREPADDRALIVLFGSPPNPASRRELLISHFEDLAKRCGLAFFCDYHSGSARKPRSEPLPDTILRSSRN